MTEELMINESACNGSQDDYDAIKMAVEKLSFASQEQFETMKNEKWYNRVFDMVTFSQKGKKRLAEQIGTVAQAQQIFIELLLRLSSNDANISKIVTDSLDDIHRIQEQNIYLLSRIKQLENVALGIKADMDIDKLTNKGKQILSACLYMINEKNGEASDAQRAYANAVISYLDVDVQMDNPTAALEEMDNDSKRRILTCCMEYIFLKNCSNDDYDEFEDFIDEFDFGNKTIRRIEKQIRALYNLRGCEGFYTKYQADNFEEIDDMFIFDFDDATEDTDSIEIEMTDEIITSIMQVRSGEAKVYCNKNIHLRAYINCEGNLDFDHCVIYYNESDAGDEITIAKGAKLSITNSLVICKGFDKNPFITCEGENEIIIESTTFVDCSYFIKSDNNRSFIMTRCELQNCYGDFISIYIGNESTCEISNNLIIQEDLSLFHIDNKDNFWNPELITISSYGENRVQFKENVIVEDEKFRKAGLKENVSDNKLCYFICSNAEVKSCSFTGISSPINAPRILDCKFENCTKGIQTKSSWRSTEKTLVDNCVFVNCTDVIRAEDDTRITNCQFVSCYNNLIFPSGYNGGIYVEFCQFINTKDRAEDNLGTYIIHYKSCITFRRAKESKTKANYLKKCIFDGVEMDDNFLIAAIGFEKPSGTVTYIEGCDFKNCSTKRSSGKIIKEYIQYDTLFKKNQNFQANRISDCRGLDKVNKEGTETNTFEIRKTTTVGNPIGSALTAGSAGVVAFAIGGPIGLGAAAGVSTLNAVRKMVQ